MRLSHEIIVLDYGDEQTSPHDFDKPLSRPRGGNCEFSNHPGLEVFLRRFCTLPLKIKLVKSEINQ